VLSRRQANLAPRLRPAKLFLLGTSGVRTAGEPARFVLIAPLPPTTGSVKTSGRRTSSVIALCTVSMLSLTVKNQTADSQIGASSGRRLENSAYEGLGLISIDWANCHLLLSEVSSQAINRS
jgi:hypothetical protein